MPGEVVVMYMGNEHCEVLKEASRERIAVGPMAEPGYSPIHLVAAGLGT
ncbi:MAG: hypothetical protein NTW87_09015 [Planctomycetota bacterium]|nr:hypothetical protein [Planctomycetota bacterium]